MKPNPYFLDLFDFAWFFRFLQPKQNFFNYYVVINCVLTFCPTNILVASAVLWFSLNL